MGELRRPFYTTIDTKTGKKVRRQSKVWWVRYYSAGRRHEESSHSTKKGDAERLLRIREGDVAKGLPVTSQAGRLRFDEAAAAVVTDYKINGRRSLREVKQRIRAHLEPHFGGPARVELSAETDHVVEFRWAGGETHTRGFPGG